MAFTSDPSTHRQCFNVNITDDEALEDTERFNLRLTLLGGSIPVVVSPDISVVEIIDNDCKYSTTPLRFENYNTFYPCYTQSYVSALKWISYQSVKVLAQLSCVFGSSLMLLYFQIMRRSTSFSILCLQLDQLVRHYAIMDTHRRSSLRYVSHITLTGATDYVEITASNNPLVAFTSDPSTHRQCFNVTITDDEALEDTENFFLNLTLGENSTVPVVILPDSTQVDINDDDGNSYTRFTNTACTCITYHFSA